MHCLINGLEKMCTPHECPNRDCRFPSSRGPKGDARRGCVIRLDSNLTTHCRSPPPPSAVA